MSNIILPLDHIDFSASIAEITPYLEDQVLSLAETDWTKTYFVLVEPNDLPETSAALSQLNLTMLNMVYLEAQGGFEHYQATQVNSCIILPLDSDGCEIGAYSAPIGTGRQPNALHGYYKEDCELIEKYSLAQPLFTGSEIENAELVYSFHIPKGKLYKALIIFVNEPNL